MSFFVGLINGIGNILRLLVLYVILSGFYFVYFAPAQTPPEPCASPMLVPNPHPASLKLMLDTYGCANVENYGVVR